MKKNKDTYGKEVEDFLKGEKYPEIVERSDGLLDLSGGSVSYFAEFKDWPKIQKEGIKYAHGKVLDVGAGAGRVCLYLQKKGQEAVAIDNSPLAISTCKKRGVKQAKVLPIEEIDKFKPETFDSIIMYGNGFGLFASFKKAKRLLKKFHKITTPNALIIAEARDPYQTKDPIHLDYLKANRKKGRMSGQLRIRVRCKKFIGPWFDYLLVSRKEMEEILEETGWKIKKIIKGNSPMYVAIIEKEKNKS